ncbi:hypothetical protein [Arachnia propionica]|uniref:Uncharacterized protein n=1 Tax=Arachnia propionica TaxID=1750 RepID=A0A3P1WSU0_9ACTN|nr:hypothetical protein [Arachnia propionica]RRD48390.1 hypothetical protein EII35_13160 [Arachnia propionica]
MAEEEPPLTWWGALIMVGLLVLAIAGSALPMMAAVLGVAWLPWFGEPTSWNPAMMLHFLWIYPMVWFASLVVDSVVKHSFTTESMRRVGGVVGDLLVWLLVAMSYRVLFRDDLGALVAALASLLLMKPFVAWLERRDAAREAD